MHLNVTFSEVQVTSLVLGIKGQQVRRGGTLYLNGDICKVAFQANLTMEQVPGHLTQSRSQRLKEQILAVKLLCIKHHT